MIDSLNFSSNDLEALFTDENYIIEPIKGVGVFEPQKWVKEFGKHLTRNIIEAKLLHTLIGDPLPIKRYSSSKFTQTIEFAGLYGYNERSMLLKGLLKELLPYIGDCYIKRMDIAVDFKGKVPRKVLAQLKKNRYSFTHKNTNYFKTEKEKKSNPRLNIKKYDKALKENLPIELERLEFVFQGGYFGKLLIKDLDIAYTKIAKTIKRFSGMDIKILSIS